MHLATAVASGLMILAFLVVRSYLREAGEDRFSALGVPFVVIGSSLFAFLPGMEFAPLAAAETGATTTEIEAAQEALASWFLPVLVTGALAFAIGVFGRQPRTPPAKGDACRTADAEPRPVQGSAFSEDGAQM